MVEAGEARPARRRGGGGTTRLEGCVTHGLAVERVVRCVPAGLGVVVLDPLVPLGQVTEDQFDGEFGTNVKGLFFTVQKALPLLRDGASIILNASIVASKGLSSNSVYSATKAAVRSFARTWTTDLKDRRIRVNAISPGPIDTPGLSELLASSETGEQRKKMISNTVPLGRFGAPEEIAKAVVFLASDDASYITGIELFVDGGFAQV